MEDLQRGHITLSPAFITGHLQKIEKEFDVFKKRIDSELKQIESENVELFSRYSFDKKTGRGYKPIKNLSSAEKKLKDIVNKRFSFADYFIEDKNNISNRNQIYYSTFSDSSRHSQVIKFFLYLDTLLSIFQEIKKEDFTNDNFIIATLLDDIRYKFILLYEDVLDNKIQVDLSDAEYLTSNAITNYYNYLLGVPQFIISYTQMIAFTKKARKFILEYLEKFDKNHKPLRKYKEADIPLDNLLFINKLKHNLPEEEIQCIIGLRFGGIELPFLIKHFIYPNAEIRQLKISNYSDTATVSGMTVSQFVEDERGFLKTKNVLIVDDSITTGRTVQVLIDALKDNTKDIYFSCVYYSQKQRIPQMRMEDHGGVNLEQLAKCCVLKQTNYTASANMKGYLGKNKKFDLTKDAIEKRLEKNPQKISFPKEESIDSDFDKQKVFIACDKAMIPTCTDDLLFIRNYFDSKKEYKILDDWIGGTNKRIDTESKSPIYKEVDGRDFLNDAFTDIRNSHIFVIYYPAPSVYLSLLFRIAEAYNKEMWICYSKKDEIKGFEKYDKKRLIQVTKLRKMFAPPTVVANNLLKVCKIDSVTFASYALKQNVDFLGIHVLEKKNIGEKMELVVFIKEKNGSPVIVTKIQVESVLEKLITTYNPVGLQLHFEFDLNLFLKLKLKFPKLLLFAVITDKSKLSDLKAIENSADYLIYDTSFRGGTSMKNNYVLFEKFSEKLKAKTLLAGGISFSRIQELLPLKAGGFDIQSYFRTDSGLSFRRLENVCDLLKFPRKKKLSVSLTDISLEDINHTTNFHLNSSLEYHLDHSDGSVYPTFETKKNSIKEKQKSLENLPFSYHLFIKDSQEINNHIQNIISSNPLSLTRIYVQYFPGIDKEIFVDKSDNIKVIPSIYHKELGSYVSTSINSNIISIVVPNPEKKVDLDNFISFMTSKKDHFEDKEIWLDRGLDQKYITLLRSRLGNNCNYIVGKEILNDWRNIEVISTTLST